VGHPLEGVRAKLERAEESIEELEREFGAFLAGNPYEIPGKFYPKRSEYVFRFRVIEPLPLRWGVLVGEIVHDLRSALDHLLWQLVILDGGGPGKHTQFPIFNRFADYRRLALVGTQRSPPMLKGLGGTLRSGHVAAITRTQPYRRPNGFTTHPLWLLARLSNIDKHQLLHTTAHIVEGAHLGWRGVRDVAAVHDVSKVVRVPIQDGAVLARLRIQPSGPHPEMHVKPQLTLSVVFKGRERVINRKRVYPALRSTSWYVRKIVETFEPSFP
jgi:hypothetical protein